MMYVTTLKTVQFARLRRRHDARVCYMLYLLKSKKSIFISLGNNIPTAGPPFARRIDDIIVGAVYSGLGKTLRFDQIPLALCERLVRTRLRVLCSSETTAACRYVLCRGEL